MSMRKNPEAFRQPVAENLTERPGARPSRSWTRTSPDGALDGAALEQLQELQLPGRPNLVERVVSNYLQSSQPQLDDLKEALRCKDHRGIQALAGSMKLASVTVGALQLASLFRELETKGRERLDQDLEANMSRIEGQYSRVVQELRTLMRGETGDG